MGCKNVNFERKFPRWLGIKIIIFTKIDQMWKRILLRSDNRLYFCIPIECSTSNDKNLPNHPEKYCDHIHFS